MGENYIFCIDVKSHNMIVTNQKRVRIIDFDSDYCASKESPFNRNINTILNDLKQIDSTFTKKKVLSGYLTLNILQVAAFADLFIYPKKYVNPYVKKLINEITIDDLVNAVACAKIKISDMNDAIYSLKHYAGKLIDGGADMDPETYICLLFLKLKFGQSEMLLHLHHACTGGNYSHVQHYNNKRPPSQKFEMLYKDGKIIWKLKNVVVPKAPKNFEFKMSLNYVKLILEK